MNKKKKQHYVPQFYLRNFTRQDNKFTLINLKTNSIIENAPCKDQCYENYYYGIDEKWEKKLGAIETEASIIIKKIIDSNTYYPNTSEIKVLKKYILFQRIRTVDNTDNFLDIELKFIDVYLKNLFKNNNIKLPNNVLVDVKKTYKARTERTIPQKNLKMISKLHNAFDDLDCIIINYNTTKNKLISSDNPVIFYNYFSPHSIGISCVGLIVLLPISDTKIIVLFDSKMYPRYKNKKIILLSNEKEVELLNCFQVALAKEIVYFKDKTQAPKVKILQKKKEEIMKPLESISLKTATGEIHNFHHKHITLKYEFSFCKLHSKARVIKIRDYDLITRTKDTTCEQIMIGKQKASKDPILSKKLLRKQVKEMEKLNKFIYDYWNDKL